MHSVPLPVVWSGRPGKLLLVLASIVFLGSEGLVTIYCLTNLGVVQ
jgi:hypothetical protein